MFARQTGKPSTMDELLTVEEAAKLLKVSAKTIRRWYQEGKIPCYRLGYRTVRIFPSEVESYLQRKKSGTPKPRGKPGKISEAVFDLPPAGVGDSLWE